MASRVARPHARPMPGRDSRSPSRPRSKLIVVVISLAWQGLARGGARRSPREWSRSANPPHGPPPTQTLWVGVRPALGGARAAAFLNSSPRGKARPCTTHACFPWLSVLACLAPQQRMRWGSAAAEGRGGARVQSAGGRPGEWGAAGRCPRGGGGSPVGTLPRWRLAGTRCAARMRFLCAGGGAFLSECVGRLGERAVLERHRARLNGARRPASPSYCDRDFWGGGWPVPDRGGPPPAVQVVWTYERGACVGGEGVVGWPRGTPRSVGAACGGGAAR